MTMNYINSIGRLLAVSVAVWMASCHGDLDIMQDNKLSVSNMWKTSVQVESSTYGIYAAMRENFNQDQINVLFWGELRMGGYMWGPSHVAQVWVGRDVIENIMTSSTASANWSKLYSAIDQANAVLKYAPLVPMTDAQRSWAVWQAAFARAFCYFWAARLWGDVPLNLNPIESVSQPETYPFRAPKAEVYARIAADIQTALDNAANLGKDKYLATADAVNMLKAEYALWMYSTQKGGDGYLAMASDALSAIGVKAGDARFMSKYADVFDGRGSGNKCSAETIFALYNLCRSARTEIPPQQEGPACNTPSDISAGQRHAGKCSRLALYGNGIAESDIALDREEVRLESRAFVFLYMNIYAHLSGT